jgi:hypothetical protein
MEGLNNFVSLVPILEISHRSCVLQRPSQARNHVVNVSHHALVSYNVAPRVRRSCMCIMQPYGLHTYKVRTQACVVLQLVVAHPCRASENSDRSRDDCPRVCFSQLPDHAAESDHVEPCFGARSDRRPDQRPRNTQG